MCTILCHWRPDADVAVLIAANRDEFRDRVADDPGEIARGVFAGRDRLAGGTWLALSARGIAALTNVRTDVRDPAAPTRGTLPPAALAGTLPADLGRYNAFNLLIVDRDGARVVTHEGPGTAVRTTRLLPGVHVVDNAPFGAPSPRVERARALAASTPIDFGLLSDHGTAGPADGLCHHGELYGTVSATVVALDRTLRVLRYAHVSGPPCRGVTIDLTDRARRVTGSA